MAMASMFWSVQYLSSSSTNLRKQTVESCCKYKLKKITEAGEEGQRRAFIHSLKIATIIWSTKHGTNMCNYNGLQFHVNVVSSITIH